MVSGSSGGRTSGVLRLLGAVALGYSGYLHLRLALERPPLLADGGITLSGLFLAQAAAVAVVVLWVAVRGSRAAWVGFAAVAVGSLLAVLLSVYVQIPAIGPIPSLYEPLWYFEKTWSAISAGVAVLVAVIALVVLRRPSGPPPGSGPGRRARRPARGAGRAPR
ncbi:hypothetical protein [Actinotalea sp. K2]|uniref:hypothetical protein n=1 Tax=Actinotalea sp. K2 TaxID=2939438 RepID=UPI002016F0E2|nr:hypothetical protein [Actinotalea sp. K2]MCL3861691.1 hypothetical protein [Actinotalea sp. K2]